MTKIRTTVTAALAGVALAVTGASAASAHPDPTGEITEHTQLVSYWYLDLLDRAADADDDGTVTGAARYWVDQLDAGVPDADVLRSITRSQEHADLVVYSPEGVVVRTNGIFETFMRRSASSAEHTQYYEITTRSAIEALIEVATSEGYEEHASVDGDFS